MTGFIGFPPREEILTALQEIGELRTAGGDREELAKVIADRLDSRVYDAAAFTFILMEVLHEHEDGEDGELSGLLRQVILALTQDGSLADTAAAAFDEIHQLIAK